MGWQQETRAAVNQARTSLAQSWCLIGSALVQSYLRLDRTWCAVHGTGTKLVKNSRMWFSVCKYSMRYAGTSMTPKVSMNIGRIRCICLGIYSDKSLIFIDLMYFSSNGRTTSLQHYRSYTFTKNFTDNYVSIP